MLAKDLALGTKDLPEAPRLRKLIGPSFIILGLGLGSGEVVLWPYMASNYGLGIVWGIGIGLASFVAQILGKIAEAFSTNPSYMALYVLLLLGNTVIAWLIVSFSAFISAHISVGIYHALRTAGPKKTEVRQA